MAKEMPLADVDPKGVNLSKDAQRTRHPSSKAQGKGPRSASGKLDTESKAREEVAAGSDHARKEFSESYARAIEHEKQGAKGVFADALDKMVAWLPFKPSLQTIADAMAERGDIYERRRRIMGANNRERQEIRPNRQNATMIRDMALWCDPQYITNDDTKARVVAVTKAGVEIPTRRNADGTVEYRKFNTPSQAMRTGEYPKSVVYNAFREAIKAPQRIGTLPKSVTEAVEKKAAALSIPVRIVTSVKGSDGHMRQEAVTKDATGDPEASAMVVKTLIARWRGKWDAATVDSIVNALAEVKSEETKETKAA